MRIYLNQNELKEILVEKYGKANFEIFYEETDKQYEERTNIRIMDLKKPPEKNSCYLYL